MSINTLHAGSDSTKYEEKSGEPIEKKLQAGVQRPTARERERQRYPTRDTYVWGSVTILFLNAAKKNGFLDHGFDSYQTGK